MIRRHRSSLRRGALAAVLAAGAMSGDSAGAATPFVLDGREEADDPSVAVDGEGAAHFAWREGGVAGGNLVHYCKVPRNQRACAIKRTMQAPEIDFGGPKVRLPGDGSVVILTGRCCSPEAGEVLYVFSSADGGNTFAGPTAIGSVTPSGDAELGPGGFSASVITTVHTGGVHYQAAPLAGPRVTTDARVGENPGAQGIGAFDAGSIAFVDPLTPIVAMTDLNTVYFRRFGGGTAYNDLGAWSPLTPVGAGSEPRLAGTQDGKRGVHLLMKVGRANSRAQLVTRPYNGTGFASPVNVSESGDPIFPDYFQDPSGRLHATWQNNHDDTLRHRTSTTGKSWKPIERLATEKQTSGQAFYHETGAAARDGGGFVVWDNNNGGPVRAVQFGSTKPVGEGGGDEGDCVDRVQAGGATVLARGGCLARSGDRYTTSDGVRVNGIDLNTPGGAKVTIDKGDRTLVTSGKVEGVVGNVVLARQALSWRFPTGDGQITDLAGNPAKFEAGSFGTDFLGLDVTGYVVPSLQKQGAKATLPVNLALPAPFDSLLGGSASGSILFRTSNDTGLQLNGLKVHVEDVSLGIAEIETFDLDYVADPFDLFGQTNILLPVIQSRLGVEFRFLNGDFEHASGEAEFGPGLLPVATDVLLRKIRFQVQKASSCGKPTKIGGGVTFTAQPEVAGVALIQIDGDVSYSFPQGKCNLPGVLDVKGEGRVVGIKVATIESRFTTDGQFRFKTNLAIDAEVVAVSLALDVGIDIPAEQFYGAIEGSVSLFGYDAFHITSVVSNVGMAACGQVLIMAAGFEYKWGGSIEPDWPPTCDVDVEEYKPSAFKSSRGRAAATGTFTLPKGLPFAEARVDGVGAAPGVVVTGPGGLAINHPGPPAAPTVQPKFKIVPVPTELLTYVRLEKPAAGTYTVTPAPGTAIAGVSLGRGLPEPSVTGSVKRGKGRTRVLSYRVRPITGQRVRFIEQSGSVRNMLALAKGTKGTLAFRPADGPAGRRTIFALVESDGMPRAMLKVATFVAPPRARPGKPRRVRLHRAGTRLLVTWGAAPGATRYAVRYVLRDGRRRTEIVRRRRLFIRGVPGINAGTISVAGLRRDNVRGLMATAKLKAKPKKVRKPKKPKKRRRR